MKSALSRLSALAHDGRLDAFRSLVRAGHRGMAAGDIAACLGVAPPTLSAQLSTLAQAGLVTSRRDGRSIIYAADVPAISELIVFLLRDCCADDPAVSAPVLRAAQDACCHPLHPTE